MNEIQRPNPPYVSFGRFLAFIERSAKKPKQPPAQIRLASLGPSSATQAQMISALRFFGLMEQTGHGTTDDFKNLTRMGAADRRTWLAEALADRYEPLLAVSENHGTAQQMHDWFRRTCLYQGGTLEKACRFFLHAAEYAKVPVSRDFSSKLPPKPAPGTLPDAPPEADAPHPNALVQAMIEVLPPEGETWPSEERTKWMQALESILDLVYQPTSE